MLVPVPDNGIVSVALDAFDVMLMLPVVLPADFGANATLNVMLWVLFNVVEAEIPLI